MLGKKANSWHFEDQWEAACRDGTTRRRARRDNVKAAVDLHLARKQNGEQDHRDKVLA